MSNIVEKLIAASKSGNGVYPEDLNSEVLREAECENVVALIPKDYQKRIRYFGNLFVQMCFSNKIKDEQLKIEMSQLSQALSYLINSSSFRDGKYYEFDKIEISRKLRRQK